MPGSPNAVKTALSLIIDELPHFVHHVKKWWNNHSSLFYFLIEKFINTY
jgi:hypothetical protein